jgi:hypothetical protein
MFLHGSEVLVARVSPLYSSVEILVFVAFVEVYFSNLFVEVPCLGGAPRGLFIFPSRHL